MTEPVRCEICKNMEGFVVGFDSQMRVRFEKCKHPVLASDGKQEAANQGKAQ